MLDSALIESPAMKALTSRGAVFCLIRFHQKAHRKGNARGKKAVRRMKITNNGEIIFTYAEAKWLGLSKSTFRRALEKLIEIGFIDVEEQGSWYQQEPTRFSISNRWRQYGTKRFKPVPIERILPKGLGFQKQKPVS